MILIICLSNFLYADIIIPKVQDARDRLKSNPDVYDRVDNLCQGKNPKDRCTISGPVISGGGEGTCINALTNDTIDLMCVRTKYVIIDKQIPFGEMKSDRFCKGKKIGNPCKIEFVYDDKAQIAEGTCKLEVERKRSYYPGTYKNRSTVQCQPEPLPQRTYTTVDFINKLMQ